MHRRPALRVVLACGLLALAAGCGATARRAPVARRLERAAARPTCGGPVPDGLGYRWPVWPFDEQHPIRGGFGDPRTVSTARFGDDAVDAPGDYSFHNGVDISARAGTPVYPVVSGRAHVVDGQEVRVRARGDRIFQYVHILPLVHTGEHVVAGVTPLGEVLMPFRHVHLAEIDHGLLVDPLLHLRPYADRTIPVVVSVSIVAPDGHAVDPERISGPVQLVADAYDMPALPVPGAWDAFPVAPALVTASILTPGGRAAWQGTAADFRLTEPPKQDFWRVYAAGTYQNFPVFAGHYYWRHRGRYLFRLTAGPLDTRLLPSGDYTLRVAAADLCGNQGLLEEPIAIRNAEGAAVLRQAVSDTLGRARRGDPRRGSPPAPR